MIEGPPERPGRPPAREDTEPSTPEGVRIHLPGEHRLDEDLVQSAVADLNQIHLDCALDYCLQVGEYILDRFFAGRVSYFERRSRSHASFRSLARSGALTFSATYLWTSVAVVCQIRQLPREVASSLPLSHHRILLGIDDLNTKRLLAGRAHADGLSKRQLADIVRRHRREKSERPGPGRPAHPPVLKHLKKLDDALRALAETETPDLEVDERFRARVGKLVDRVEGELGALEELLGQLRARLGGD